MIIYVQVLGNPTAPNSLELLERAQTCQEMMGKYGELNTIAMRYLVVTDVCDLFN